MPEIAIVKYTEHLCYDDHIKIAQSISDWEEVSDKEYKDINTWVAETRNSRNGGSYLILERSYYKDIKEEIISTVKQAAAKAAKYKADQGSAAAKRALAKQEKALKKRAKTEEEEKKLLEELKKKYSANPTRSD